MSEKQLGLSSGFADATEADWLKAVEKALKGRGIEAITRATRDGIAIRPLYRETDFRSSENLGGAPGDAPYLRGGHATPDAFLPWDIRQAFSHPDPETTNLEIIRDLERGVSSINLWLDCSGKRGCVINSKDDLATALRGVRADLATIALSHHGAGTGASAAALLADWAKGQEQPTAQKLAFNISLHTPLMLKGTIQGGIDYAAAKAAALSTKLSEMFPASTAFKSEALIVHEAGGSEAQELGVLIAGAVDLMRRLDAAGAAPEEIAGQILFMLSVDANYGIGIAKQRAARRLWARVLDALGLTAAPMQLHAVTSARMLTKYDPWVNMLRGTAACFAGAVGGADMITVRPFNEALGVPEELGRRIARNTQIIAMEESGLGRVADPSGGAWFSETLAGDLAAAGWAEFQMIEAEGGLATSLIDGKLQARIEATRDARQKDIARRKVPITGVSEFPLLEGIAAPVAEIGSYKAGDGYDPEPLKDLIGDMAGAGDDTTAPPLTMGRLAAPFEALRDRAEGHLTKTGQRPSIFLATLGPLAEFTARADFARNLFAAGGLEAKEPPVPPTGEVELAAAFKASGCAIAVICGGDKRYDDEAASAANALKEAGAVRIWLAGKFEAENIDSHIRMGCDVVHECTLALAELGVK